LHQLTNRFKDQAVESVRRMAKKKKKMKKLKKKKKKKKIKIKKKKTLKKNYENDLAKSLQLSFYPRLACGKLRDAPQTPSWPGSS